MFRDAITFWTAVLAVGFIATVQYQSHSRVTTRAAMAEFNEESAAGGSNSDIISIFGREYDRSAVEGWYGTVRNNYCLKNGELCQITSHVSGSPMTYEMFVQALQCGHYFPELAGAGVLGDGERVILQHKGMKRAARNSAKVHINGTRSVQ